MRGEPGAGGSAGGPRPESGFTLIEVVVASALSLVAASVLYSMLISSRRLFVLEADRAEAAATGRAVLEVIASDLRQAGYAPFGGAIVAIPYGSAAAVRRLADLDANGLTSGADEDLLYALVDPDGDGVYDLLRGRDADGNGSFGGGEAVENVASGLAPTDADGNGVPDAFFAYDVSPPATARVTVSFEMRLPGRSRRDRRAGAVPFHAVVQLRNR